MYFLSSHKKYQTCLPAGRKAGGKNYSLFPPCSYTGRLHYCKFSIGNYYHRIWQLQHIDEGSNKKKMRLFSMHHFKTVSPNHKQ